MCVPQAAQVVEVGPHDSAVVVVRGRTRQVSLILLSSEGEAVHPGDWLLLHTGLPVARISAEEAAAMERLAQGAPPVHRQGAGHD